MKTIKICYPWQEYALILHQFDYKVRAFQFRRPETTCLTPNLFKIFHYVRIH